MWRGLRDRELGAIRPQRLSSSVCATRIRELELSTHKEIVSSHKSGINSLQIDLIEERYLLTGASDGSVGVYDTQQASNFESGLHINQHKALFTVDKTAAQGHQYTVSSVSWYPVDTGLFVTGSFDHHINLWNTNTLQVELQFKMPGKVYAVGMSPIASTHMLIAAGTEDARVRLCDIASGAFTHSLSGHRDGVWAVQWSVSSEWVVFTGGCDGAIRFWDIRRAGSYLVLDQQHSQIGRRPPVVQNAGGSAQARAHATGDLGSTTSSLKSRAAPTKSVVRKVLAKDSTAHRLHPGLASTQDRATAHYGAVTALQPTVDGLYILSAGIDSRVRLWDIGSGCNTLVNYESTRIRGNKGMQIAVSSDTSLLFVPSGTVIKVYNLWTGSLHKILRGHYDSVNCCIFHPHDQELYSGSNDRKILLWGPPSRAAADDDLADKREASGTQPDKDAWSD